MAKKKETEEKKATKKLVTPTKKAKEELDKLGVKPAPIPDPVDVIMDEKGEIKEVEPIPDPEPSIDEWVNTPVPKAKPEKLGTVVIDEGIERAECEKQDLGLITTGELKPPKRGKANKAHDPANDIIITTHDFKPRTWGKSRKL